MRVALALTIALAVSCAGEDDDDGVMFELPQILPDNSPICLSYSPTTVGQVVSHVALFRNDGRQQLVVESATITEDARGVFTVVGVEPKMVNTSEFTHVQLRYAPTATGWDSAFLRVMSNAQNFPNIRVFVLALAQPDNPMGFDPGPKPAAAMPGTADEACRPAM